MVIGLEIMDKNIRDNIEKLSGQTFSACIQCGVCDASCPAFLDSGFKASPRLINKFLVDGSEDKAVENELVELCMECLMCNVRCPKKIDTSKVVNALRSYAVENGRQFVDVAKIPEKVLSEVPQIAVLQFIGLHPRPELFELKKLPLRKLQRSDDVWDLETEFVKEIAQSL